MKNTLAFSAALWLSLAAVGASAQDVADAPSMSWDGLVEVKPKRVDAAFLRPGADFRPYAKLMVDPVTVAFRKDWLQRVNTRTSLSGRVTRDDAEQIAARAREIFAEVFVEAFRSAGIEVAQGAGPDVLRVRSGVIDLYLAAPDTNTSARSRTYTVESGEATLFLEASDSTTGALLGRVLDRRTTRNTGRLQVTNRVTNESDLRLLFRRWADASVEGFRELQAMSPVPEDLKPGQHLRK